MAEQIEEDAVLGIQTSSHFFFGPFVEVIYANRLGNVQTLMLSKIITFLPGVGTCGSAAGILVFFFPSNNRFSYKVGPPSV